MGWNRRWPHTKSVEDRTGVEPPSATRASASAGWLQDLARVARHGRPRRGPTPNLSRRELEWSLLRRAGSAELTIGLDRAAWPHTKPEGAIEDLSNCCPTNLADRAPGGCEEVEFKGV